MANKKEEKLLEGKWKLLSRAKQECRNMLFSKPNVNGIDIGHRVRGGKTLDEMVVKVYVTTKVSKDLLGEVDLIPANLTIGKETVSVDVEESMMPRAQVFNLKSRPLIGGSSIGVGNGIGTLGVCILYRSGVYILSNDHVLTGSGSFSIGSTVNQPSEADADVLGDVPVAVVTNRVPTDFGTTTYWGWTVRNSNRVDAALAVVMGHTSHNINKANRAIYWIGYPNFEILNLEYLGFWAQGRTVHKMGRTSHYTVGTVESTSWDTDIDYSSVFGNPDGTNIARFIDQLRIVGTDGPFSETGDSGSLVLDADSNRPVGLLFAGDDKVSVANNIGRVMAALAIQRI